MMQLKLALAWNRFDAAKSLVSDLLKYTVFSVNAQLEVCVL